jgi:hypothetical protein
MLESYFTNVMGCPIGLDEIGAPEKIHKSNLMCTMYFLWENPLPLEWSKTVFKHFFFQNAWQ